MAVLKKKITNRIRILRALVVVLLAIYALNLFSMQILRKQLFTSEAERISLQSTRIPAPRGEIYDRTGRVVLAGNIEAYSVYITPSELPATKRESVILLLSKLLNISAEDIESKLPTGRLTSYGRVAVAKNASLSAISEIAAHIDEFPGVSWTSQPLRDYADLRSLSNTIGYVGSITRDEYKLFYNKGYTLEDLTGKAGIELIYEDLLKGKDGWIAKAVDVHGKDISRNKARIEAPEPGKRLILSIDSNIQKIAEDALGKRQGSVVVLKPATGEILAMATYPYYDSRVFMSDNAGQEYLKLLNDPQKPMLNRAYQSSYPPASTFKTVLSTAILEEGFISPDKTIYCSGEINYGGRSWSCWIKKPGHGAVDLKNALAQSCDIYYWTVGRDYIGVENIVSYAQDYGYGKLTGIDLPGENPGLLPTPTWKEEKYNDSWTPGDTMNLSIGQGYMLASPLQVANMMAMIVNGGVIYKPHVLKEIRDPGTGALINEVQPEVLQKSSISEKTFETMRSLLRGVIVYGTARAPISTKAVQIAGKTGTGEIGLKDRWHSWFASFGPYDAPAKDQIVVVTMIEASNPWEWWGPYAANVIYQAIYAGQDAKTAAATVGVKLDGIAVGGRRE
ncbi:Penicillin-binding protein 2 [uncultured spirochete]|jgi:penicillin-binding protein 2|uniref:Penicillin-binding protein 2 n=1 Tax=uncultured spirochete TaxID=156406 RepID=A0A3P3XFK0_9SPIR|nr:penicillin-binding protein 2 [Rectinema subterraneum]SLM09882.1 Penicillin-binding protein 2 [uncultured spirochete]HBE46961.1 penicillin-binding protein 2 [Spirochaetaceae bacterium]